MVTDFAAAKLDNNQFPLDFARPPVTYLTGAAGPACSPTVGSAPMASVLPTVYESPNKERRATGGAKVPTHGVNIYTRSPGGATGATPPKDLRDSSGEALVAMEVDMPTRTSKPSLFNRSGLTDLSFVHVCLLNLT